MELEDKLLRIYAIVISSFLAGFSICMNNEIKKKKPNFLLALTEVLVHGVSGCIVGMLTSNYTRDIFMICAISAIGGLSGKGLVNIVLKIGISLITNAKNINLDDTNKKEGK